MGDVKDVHVLLFESIGSVTVCCEVKWAHGGCTCGCLGAAGLEAMMSCGSSGAHGCSAAASIWMTGTHGRWACGWLAAAGDGVRMAHGVGACGCSAAGGRLMVEVVEVFGGGCGSGEPVQAGACRQESNVLVGAQS